MTEVTRVVFFVSFIGLFYSLPSFSGDYQVSRIYASGAHWFVRYTNLADANSPSGNNTNNTTNFSISIDQASESVFIHYATEQLKGACKIALNDVDNNNNALASVYLDALELAENADRINTVRISPFGDSGLVYDGLPVQYCQEINDVSFRNTITMACGNAYTYWGQSAYIVGSSKLLGQWDPSQAIKLAPSAYPYWSQTVSVEANQDIEWKCIKRDEQNAQLGIEWQSGHNAYFYSGNTSGQYANFQ